MTRERFEAIRREWEAAVACQSSFTDNALLLLWGETIKGLEEAREKLTWIDRNLDGALAANRGLQSKLDDSLQECLALTIEKDRMQILIDELRKVADRYETARRLNPAQWADARRERE